ncbi:MAG: hypothetical protein WDW38_001958 [Sanguina aurantia]
MAHDKWFWLKLVFCPFILLLEGFNIYLLGACKIYAERLGRVLAYGCCVMCGRTFVDKAFQPTAASIGAWDNKSPGALSSGVKWRRVQDVIATGGKVGARLFSGRIEPADICQGQLGDCWLLSALACLAAHEGAVQEVFITDEYSHYGKYRVKLFNRPTNKWVYLNVDDHIPVDAGTGQCIFAKPNGDEAWVLILEKAMAKFKGSYAALDGGSSLGRCSASGPYDYELLLTDKQQSFTPEQAFMSLMLYKRAGAIIGASTGTGSDKENTNGIVHGHAYSILAVKEVHSFKMLCLRNPWGSFEWTGNWCDASPLWAQYPKVALALNHTAADDGTFWMEFKDFVVYFKNTDVCRKSKGWHDLALDVHEESPCMGPAIGCVEGCWWYWLCCKGVAPLFAPPPANKFEVLQQPGCLAC